MLIFFYSKEYGVFFYKSYDFYYLIVYKYKDDFFFLKLKLMI